MPIGLIGGMLLSACCSCGLAACKGEAEHNIVRELPGIGSQLAFGRGIALANGFQQPVKRAVRRTADAAPDHPLPVAPDPRLLHGGAEVHALPNRVREASEEAQLPAEGPEHDNRLHAFGAQAAEDLDRSPGIAFERGIDQLVDVVPAAVCNSVGDIAAVRSGCNPAARMRAAIHPGNSLILTGQMGRNTPFASIALTHLAEVAFLSSFAALTINMSSGPSRSTNSTIALLPTRPGLPVGRRNSMMRCSANRDRLELDAVRLAQSNHCVAT
jgi:hypothetical protein